MVEILIWVAGRYFTGHWFAMFWIDLQVADAPLGISVIGCSHSPVYGMVLVLMQLRNRSI